MSENLKTAYSEIQDNINIWEQCEFNKTHRKHFWTKCKEI